ncbi:MAG: acyl-(acyl-carrier-protein)-UDP-N-acetylglucosamine O-acyltransferase [Fibrobacterota bacterium]|jgi:UDP-N-acetylglucosamine acyltransferase
MNESLVHRTAVVDATAKIGERVKVGPFAIIEPGAEIGADCCIGPHACIASSARLGIEVSVGNGAVLGGMPQIKGFDGSMLGICRIGDGARIGEFVTVHSGSSPQGCTRVGAGAFLMAYSHVGHDCDVGADAVLANAVQLGGHVKVGSGAFLGGAAVIHQHCQVGELAFVAGGIPIDRDVLPWSRVIGNPATWARMNLVGLRRAGWSAREIGQAGRLLRDVVRKGGVIGATQDEDESFASKQRMLLEFLQGSSRGVIRARR